MPLPWPLMILTSRPELRIHFLTRGFLVLRTLRSQTMAQLLINSELAFPHVYSPHLVLMNNQLCIKQPCPSASMIFGN